MKVWCSVRYYQHCRDYWLKSTIIHLHVYILYSDLNWIVPVPLEGACQVNSRLLLLLLLVCVTDCWRKRIISLHITWPWKKSFLLHTITNSLSKSDLKIVTAIYTFAIEEKFLNVTVHMHTLYLTMQHQALMYTVWLYN